MKNHIWEKNLLKLPHHWEVRHKVGGIKKQIAEIIDKTWIKKRNFKSCVYERSHDYKRWDDSHVQKCGQGRGGVWSNWVITTWLCIRKTRPRIAMGKRPTNVSTFISNVTLWNNSTKGHLWRNLGLGWAVHKRKNKTKQWHKRAAGNGEPMTWKVSWSHFSMIPKQMCLLCEFFLSNNNSRFSWKSNMSAALLGLPSDTGLGNPYGLWLSRFRK